MISDSTNPVGVNESSIRPGSKVKGNVVTGATSQWLSHRAAVGVVHMHIYQSTLKRALLETFRSEFQCSNAVQMEDLRRAWDATGLRGSDFSDAVMALLDDGAARKTEVNGQPVLELNDVGMAELRRPTPLSAGVIVERMIDQVSLARLRMRHRSVVRSRNSRAARAEAAGRDNTNRRLARITSAIRMAACKLLTARRMTVGDFVAEAMLIDDWKDTGLRGLDFTLALGGLAQEGFLFVAGSEDCPIIVLKRPLPRSFRLNDRLFLFKARRRGRSSRPSEERRA